MLFNILAILLALPLISAAARPKNAILLSGVQSLTLRGDGALSTNRRVSAIPQLKCISPSAICNLYSIDVMRCSNQGSSYGGEDVEWSCSASLPAELKLGSTDVICEGYASPDDPYVLKGSCGVEYRLVLTEVGEQRYPDIASGGPKLFGNGEGGTDYSAWIFTFIFVGILAWIVYSACVAPNRAGGAPAARRGGGFGGGGGGGGWNPGFGPDDDNNDPPPPYPGTKSSSSRQQRGWTPGFWSGAAGGAAAGYMAGSRGQNRNNSSQARSSGGGWGGGSSSSSSSSARHESTGFGSTSRR